MVSVDIKHHIYLLTYFLQRCNAGRTNFYLKNWYTLSQIIMKAKITSILLHSLIHWQLNGYAEGKNNFKSDTRLDMWAVKWIC